MTKKFEFFLAGTVSSCLSVQVLAKIYEVLAKMIQNVPFSCHGEGNVSLILRQELSARK